MPRPDPETSDLMFFSDVKKTHLSVCYNQNPLSLTSIRVPQGIQYQKKGLYSLSSDVSFDYQAS